MLVLSLAHIFYQFFRKTLILHLSKEFEGFNWSNGILIRFDLWEFLFKFSITLLFIKQIEIYIWRICDIYFIIILLFDYSLYYNFIFLH